MPPRYTIEYAKSSRSSCKRCKIKIEKGELRIGTHVDNGEFEMTSWVHPGCFKLPRTMSATPEEFLDGVVEDTSEESDILPFQKDTLLDQIQKAQTPKKRKAVTKPSVVSHLKEAYEKQQEEGAGPSPKKLKTEVDSYGEVATMKVDELKDILRWNNQVLTGTKDVLQFKIIDGVQRGRLAPCMLCNGGKLKIEFENGDAKVLCSGRFDEDSQIRVPCAFTSSLEEAPRAPWYSEQPTEEQEAEMKALVEKAEGKVSNGSKDNTKALEALTKAVAKVEWDVTGKGLKKGVQDLTAAVLTTKLLDIPQDQGAAVSKIGPLVNQHRQKTLHEILPVLIQEFGLVTVKEEKAALKTKAVGSMVKIPENAELVACFKELAELYFNEGNRHAGVSSNKVVAALKDLPFAITLDNAKGLCKGKTKQPGIGKGTVEKIVDYLENGTMAKLEEKRADAA